MSVKIIEALTFADQYECMEANVRTAARSGADSRFDWDNQATWEQTLRGTTGLYLVSPVLRIDFDGLVGRRRDGQHRCAGRVRQVLRPVTATVASGNGARPNSDVLDVTGKTPVSFAEFAAKTAAAWK